MNLIATLGILDRPTLVLNKSWTPIQIMTTRRAVGLVAGGSARVIDPMTYQIHDLDSWNSASAAREKLQCDRIRSMRLALEPPEVIVLTAYSGIGARSVVFSRRNLFKRDRFTCQYCGDQPGLKELTIDHVTPRSRGGVSSWENCVLACVRCNSRKADRTPREVGMRLLKEPRKPSWKTLFGVPARGRCESWKKFLSRAYWDVELEP